jgi:hypothetical protein
VSGASLGRRGMASSPPTNLASVNITIDLFFRAARAKTNTFTENKDGDITIFHHQYNRRRYYLHIIIACIATPPPRIITLTIITINIIAWVITAVIITTIITSRYFLFFKVIITAIVIYLTFPLECLLSTLGFISELDEDSFIQ